MPRKRSAVDLDGLVDHCVDFAQDRGLSVDRDVMAELAGKLADDMTGWVQNKINGVQREQLSDYDEDDGPQLVEVDEFLNQSAFVVVQMRIPASLEVSRQRRKKPALVLYFDAHNSSLEKAIRKTFVAWEEQEENEDDSISISLVEPPGEDDEELEEFDLSGCDYADLSPHNIREVIMEYDDDY